MENVMAVINWVVNNPESILTIIGAFAVIANLTPNETDNKVVKVLNTIVNTLAANFNVKGNLNK